MRHRRSDHDVTDSVKTTDVDAVAGEVRRIYLDLFRKGELTALDRSFADLGALYAGENEHYHACDTGYHDLQHVLDVTLAMARLMHGYKRIGREPLESRIFCLGVILALYHDCGYIRRRHDSRHANGAEYTLTHVSRGARYLRNYLPVLGMADLAPVAARVIHFTGYEVPIAKIRVPQPVFRVIGNLLGTADILGQMADRCYLEKCHDRLFPEFELGGIARRRDKGGDETVVFASAADLIGKTPDFYETAAQRLDFVLEAAYRYAEPHFGGHNYYVTAVEQNISYARKLAPAADKARLRRRPPRLANPAQDQLQFN
ncbi:MAG: hypothetical protein JWN94_2206 [Betaproteobacteria bacterium]|nr:hypothetical protein [Betaproteobacteria bacterium]